MVLSVHQPQYIPWLGYFDKIAKSDAFVFLDLVQYKPREFENRNKIRTKDGWIWLSVPIASKGKGRQRISDCVIDNELPWRRQHWNSLKTWYGKARFFQEHGPFFEKLYAREWQKFIDVSVEIITYCLKELRIETPVYFESRLETSSMATDRIIELCGKLHAQAYLSGAGGKDYLEEEKLDKAGVKLIYQDFVHPVYHQQFMKDGNDFISHISALDLLFNEGPASREILGIGAKTP